MDWITPAKTAGWALLRVGEWVLRFCHLATVPLRYLLWHLLRLVLFLLAPVRALFGAIAAAAEFAVDLVARFKVSLVPCFRLNPPIPTQLPPSKCGGVIQQRVEGDNWANTIAQYLYIYVCKPYKVFLWPSYT